MRVVRVLATSLAILGMSTASFAGDLLESAEKAVQQQAQTPPPRIDKTYLWPGAALFVTGMSMAVYGFLHTSGGGFVSGGGSKGTKNRLRGAGVGVAGLRGAGLFLGAP